MLVKFKTNINCNNCIQKVTPFLNQLDNVDYWKVETDHPDKILTVELDDENVQLIIDTIMKAGYKAEKL